MYTVKASSYPPEEGSELVTDWFLLHAEFFEGTPCSPSRVELVARPEARSKGLFPTTEYE